MEKCYIDCYMNELNGGHRIRIVKTNLELFK